MSKKMPVSFSRLNTFEQCGKKFEYLYVLKTVQDAGSTATEYGTRVHEALEKVAKGEAEHTHESAPFAGLLTRILQQPGEKFFEYQMTVDHTLTPCGWMDDVAWIRSIADILIVNGDKAWVGDWKTGKVKDDPTQLQLFAYMTFIHFPQVVEVKTSYIWMLKGELTTMRFTRNMMGHLWNAIQPRLDRLQEAVDMGVFKAKPTPLCGWCAAKDICPDAKRR
jgi:CRISPR/Cas system-associated exonuclease Cas4 (RecB family)